MKLFASALALSVALFAQTSFAWFTVQANVNYSQVQVNAVISNPYGQPIFCQGYAYGRTYSGHVLESYISDWIPPFQYRYAYVYTNPYNPFVQAWGSAQCTF